jgi:small ligand-binding sensory domain FIST
MRWASALSIIPDSAAALEEAGARAAADLGTEAADLVVVFVSSHHEPLYREVPRRLRAHFPRAHILGCSAGGVIGAGHEIEDAAAVSVTAAALPGVTVHPMRIAFDTVPALAADGALASIMLADPFTFDTEAFVRTFDDANPGGTAIGGLASGGSQPGDNALWLGDEIYPNGLVGLALTGDVAVDTIVAQGCRPIGQPMFVTRAEGNVLHELDGQPTLVALNGLFHALAPADQALARHSLFLGIVMDATRQEYRHGDFLVRNVLGVDPRRGALVVGAALDEGHVVQFHVRDAATSSEDLTHMLARYRERPAGALLFSCLGRGTNLYGRPDHDTTAFRAAVGDVPLGGFFCNGEIGPVQGRTFLHGYTSAFGLFRHRESR